MTQGPITFTDTAGMIEAFRTIKNYLELSNSTVDHLCGFTPGHTDKLLGPTSAKRFSALSWNALVWCMAVKVTMTVDLDRVKEMADHWEKRNAAHYRPHASVISKVILRRAKPLILRDQTHNARMARAMGVSPEKRRRIARKAARVRWSRHRERERIAAEALLAAQAAESCQAHQGDPSSTASACATATSSPTPTRALRAT